MRAGSARIVKFGHDMIGRRMSSERRAPAEDNGQGGGVGGER